MSRKKVLQGIENWLRQHGYDIGLPQEDIKLKKEAKIAGALSSLVHGAVGGTKAKISGGASKEEAIRLFRPVMELVDILAFKIDFSSPVLIVGVQADDMNPYQAAEYANRISKAARPLSKVGLRRFGIQGMGTKLYTLFIYFQKANFERVVKANVIKGLKADMLHPGAILGQQVLMETGLINIPGREVLWPESRLVEITRTPAKKLQEKFGTRLHVFDTRDLQEILQGI